MEHTIGVIGAGAWGTAFAKSLAEKGLHVTIWAYEPETVAEINEKHLNTAFLPDVPLPPSLKATTDIKEAAGNKDFLFLVIPSLFLVNTVKNFITIPSIMEGKTIISILTKGLLETPSGFHVITEVLENYLPGFYRDNLVYVAGPSHAEEVATGKITGLVAASFNPKNAILVRDAINSERLLAFASLDPVGVQVCAAAKNVVAIAFGVLDALKEAKSEVFGDNTESLLLAAGLNEIQTLGRAMGATHAETFTSIAGVGDLDVTCRSVHGRNRRFGRDIIQKRIHEPFADIDDLLKRIREIPYLPEGAAACKGIHALAEEKKLKLPICDAVYRILNREVSPEEVIRDIYTVPSGKVGTPSTAEGEVHYPIVDPYDGAKMEPLLPKYTNLFMDMMKRSKGPAKITDENVYQEGNRDILPFMDKLVEDNLKPGSGIQHFENLEALYRLTQEGKSCLLLVEHYSNMDLPVFHYLLRQRGEIGTGIAESLIAIAGYKLNEENPAVQAPTEAFSRIVIYPSRSIESMKEKASPQDSLAEMLRSTSINRAATRALAEKRAGKRIILVFPAGTRYRPWDPSSKRGVREIDTYIKSFDRMVLVSVNGNVLRINPRGEMIEDLICEDKVLFDCSPVINCHDFREKVKLETEHTPGDKKQQVVDEIMRRLETMHGEVEKTRLRP